MDWITGHHWTDGWAALLASVVGIVGVVGTVIGTVVTQRTQAANTTKQIEAADKRLTIEAEERHADKVREAIADLLGQRQRLMYAAIDSLATIMTLHQQSQEHAGRKFVLSDEQARKGEELVAIANEVEHLAARVSLLTNNTVLAIHLQEVLEASVATVEAAQKVPNGDISVVTNLSSARKRLTQAFKKLRNSAADLYALPS
ncbi:hypothetical protein [Dietzia kunjamensis]|uniref:hypothetical protein n=1 Tax=Dietzia kunjamensis TaxID=322509 RepID=UPI00389080F2